MKAKLKLENDAIRAAVTEAAKREARKQPFNLSGRGHEPRVTLDRSLAMTLRGEDLPCVFISGYGANNYYPLRVFEAASHALKKKLGVSPIAFYESTVYRLKRE